MTAIERMLEKEGVALNSLITEEGTIEEALKKAGWDFRVLKGQAKCTVGRIEIRPDEYIDQDIVADNQFMLYREDNHRILSNQTTVTEGYHIFQNTQFMDMMREIAYRTGLTITRAGTVDGGKRCWLIAEFPERFSKLDVNTGMYKGDYMVPYLYVSITHDGQSTIRFQLIAERKHCSNVFTGCMGHIVQRMEEEMTDKPFDNNWRIKNVDGMTRRIRHTKSVEEQVEKAIDSIEKMSNHWGDIMAKYQRMAERVLTTEELNKLVRQALEVRSDKPDEELPTRTKNRINALLKRYHNVTLATYGKTAWDFMNAVTAMNTHDRKIKEGKSRLDNMVYGSAARFEARTFGMLNKLCKPVG